MFAGVVVVLVLLECCCFVCWKKHPLFVLGPFAVAVVAPVVLRTAVGSISLNVDVVWISVFVAAAEWTEAPSSMH